MYSMECEGEWHQLPKEATSDVAGGKALLEAYATKLSKTEQCRIL